ncbi:MAG TPA: ABC transporter ATP-binding protein [Ilumatobacter sp.]|nr:ABC transporter ATP-binding protein [Ilumatobacter sp.]
MSLLEVRGVSAGYAGEDVVHAVSFHVDPGEAITIIGSNGAGKSTLFRAIVSMLATTSGTTMFEDRDITKLPTHKISRLGLAYVPAERHLFPRMTVRENLLLGAFPARPDPAREEFVFEVFPRLAERRKQDAGTMSGGEQQMLAVARALMSQPKVLMLDEPTTGLAPRLAREAYGALARLRDAGLTLVVAEQQVPLALELASRGYVLENGRFELEGTSDELAGNPDVQRAYLGVA